MTFLELMEGFKAKQAAVLEADKKASELKVEMDAKVQAFIDENKGPVETALQEAEKLRQEYRAETKSVFGIADGEPALVIEIIETIKRIQEMQ